jgi:hypothetical protein
LAFPRDSRWYERSSVRSAFITWLRWFRPTCRSPTAFGGELRRPFSHYIGYVGLWQNWVMFHTIPHFRAIRPRLVATYPGGTKGDYGPMLPGLTKYDHRTRLGSLFFRYVWPTSDINPLRRGVHEAGLRRESRAKTGNKPTMSPCGWTHCA